MARNCVRNIGRLRSASRVLRRPRKGFFSSSMATCACTLSAPRSNVRMMTGRSPIALHDAGIGLEMPFLVGRRIGAQVQKLGAIQADAVAPRVKQ